MTPEPLLWLDSLQGSGIRPGLSRMRALLRELGNPERACPSIIVAGTNGKGSTSSTLASILNASGYRTGLYTSPHLVELRERWMIGGAMISPSALAAAIEKLRPAADRAGILPTYFEALTLLAFIAFNDANCEVMVLEVGMGGRLDATNVVRPLAALITPIGFDHTEFLGTSIRQIAGEKAGVIHRGAIVLTSNDDPRVLGVLRHRAAMFGNPFHVVTSTHNTPLAGDFQRRNAALAVRAAEELASLLPTRSAGEDHGGLDRTRRCGDAVAWAAGKNRTRRKTNLDRRRAQRARDRGNRSVHSRACSRSPPARVRDHERQGCRRGDIRSFSAVRRDHRHRAVSAAVGGGFAAGFARA